MSMRLISVRHIHKSNLSFYTRRRVARIWKRGVFWKSEKCANDLDSNLHWTWISFRRFVQKLRRNFSESSEIQSFFPPKISCSTKKKSLPWNWEWFFGRNPKFKRFFRPILGGLQKKRSSPKLRLIFRPISQIQTFEWGLFSYGGGAIFNFSQKIGLKSTKNMRFCILHELMGGARAPSAPPGYATVYSLYYAETFNEFAGPISESFVDNTAFLKEMPQGWWAVGNVVSNLTGLIFEPQTSRPRDESVSLH